ncbi:ClpXP protease specificity-enhancing factor SspB [Ancylobacter crimeensis]|uniref:SspB family protein n=1 Tax=Ancylobacter crimeensis TaxID=2579147 RepID=UPI003CCFE34B
MSVDLIRYDLLVQDALRGVVRRVLGDVSREGLPGEHHLYISFDTCAPGVRLSTRLKEKYPEEMTIVLQHQFWDLVVTEQFFEVGLSFNRVPERLHVPFAALKGFFDPSVKFGLQFEPEGADEEEAEDGPAAAPAPVQLKPVPAATPLRTEAKGSEAKSSEAKGSEAKGSEAKGTDKPAEAKATEHKPESRRAEPRPAAKTADSPRKGAEAAENAPEKPAASEKSADVGKDEPGKDAAPDNAEAPAEGGGAQVVRLDAFRKK